MASKASAGLPLVLHPSLSIERELPVGHGDQIVLTPDGRALIAYPLPGHHDPRVKAWDLDSGAPWSLPAALASRAHGALAVSPDQRRLVALRSVGARGEVVAEWWALPLAPGARPLGSATYRYPRDMGEIGGNYHPVPLAVSPGGVAFTVTRTRLDDGDDRLVRVDLASGKVDLWDNPLEGDIQGVAVVDDLLAVVSMKPGHASPDPGESTGLALLDPATGAVRGRARWVSGQHVARDERGVVWVVGDSWYVWRLDPAAIVARGEAFDEARAARDVATARAALDRRRRRRLELTRRARARADVASLESEGERAAFHKKHTLRTDVDPDESPLHRSHPAVSVESGTRPAVHAGPFAMTAGAGVSGGHALGCDGVVVRGFRQAPDGSVEETTLAEDPRGAVNEGDRRARISQVAGAGARVAVRWQGARDGAPTVTVLTWTAGGPGAGAAVAKAAKAATGSRSAEAVARSTRTAAKKAPARAAAAKKT